MNPLWPQTPRSILTRIASLSAGEDEAEWSKFVELYGPAIDKFVRLQDPSIPDADVEDMVQDTLAKLVPLLRKQAFDPQRAKFSTWLGTIIRRQMIDRLRRRNVRNMDAQVQLTPEMAAPADSDPAEAIDRDWRAACHQAAVRHVFTHSALSEQSRRIYLMSTEEGLSTNDIAKQLGMSANAVRAIRSRVARMIAAVVRQFD
jgi:RNA polymerase sigma factor (sigma-70 family)